MLKRGWYIYYKEYQLGVHFLIAPVLTSASPSKKELMATKVHACLFTGRFDEALLVLASGTPSS